MDKSNPSKVEDASPSAADPTPRLGKYLCRWLQGEKGFDSPCEFIDEGGHKILTLLVGGQSLQGRAMPTSYGFHFTGTLKNSSSGATQNLEADFFRQGDGAYAAVLTLADKSLVKLDLHP